MNQQRPLIADGSLSASSNVDISIGPSSLPSATPQKKKKPGPKRDSKPAQSEKLERNRQAQRTHRERKEQYTKDLELEVMRLKELYVQATRERESATHARDDLLRDRDRLQEHNRRLEEEVQRLREIVQLSSSSSGADSGYDGLSVTCGATRTSSLSVSDGFPTLTAPSSNLPIDTLYPQSLWELYETRGFASDDAVPQSSQVMKVEQSSDTLAIMNELPAIKMDYDAIGLDFVLSLERPCMGHIQYLHVRAHNYQVSADGEMSGQPMEVPDDGENQHISGHALMATAPPYSHIMENPGARYPTQMPDLQRENLVRLLNLSSELHVTGSELPPVRAWIKIMQDARIQALGVNEFELLKSQLLKKVNCYRFGAVISDHDILEALQYVYDAKQAATVAASTTSPLETSEDRSVGPASS